MLKNYTSEFCNREITLWAFTFFHVMKQVCRIPSSKSLVSQKGIIYKRISRTQFFCMCLLYEYLGTIFMLRLSCKWFWYYCRCSIIVDVDFPRVAFLSIHCEAKSHPDWFWHDHCISNFVFELETFLNAFWDIAKM